jgi:hypothetical protein
LKRHDLRSAGATNVLVAQPYCFDRDWYLVWTWVGKLKLVELELELELEVRICTATAAVISQLTEDLPPGRDCVVAVRC